MSIITRQVATTTNLEINGSIILTSGGNAYVAKRFATNHYTIEAATAFDGESYAPTATVEVFETFGYGKKPWIATRDGMELVNTHSLEAALGAAWVEVAS